MKKNILLVIILFLSANLYSEVLYRGIKRERPKEKSKEEIINYALVLGISDYRQFDPLKRASKDAVEIAEVLKEEKYIVRLLDETSEMINSKAQILQEINELSTLNKNSRVLLYFAGHGYLDEDSKNGYFVPRNAEKDKVDQYLSYEQIIDSIKSFNSRQVIVFVDTCYPGKLEVNESFSTIEVETNKKYELPARVVITAGQKEKRIVDGEENSYMAEALLQILRDNKGDLNNDRIITGEEAGLYIRHSVLTKSNGNQEPLIGKIYDYEIGDFLLKTYEDKKPEPNEKGQEVVVIDEKLKLDTEDEMIENTELVIENPNYYGLSIGYDMSGFSVIEKDLDQGFLQEIVDSDSSISSVEELTEDQRTLIKGTAGEAKNFVGINGFISIKEIVLKTGYYTSGGAGKINIGLEYFSKELFKREKSELKLGLSLDYSYIFDYEIGEMQYKTKVNAEDKENAYESIIFGEGSKVYLSSSLYSLTPLINYKRYFTENLFSTIDFGYKVIVHSSSLLTIEKSANSSEFNSENLDINEDNGVIISVGFGFNFK